MTAGKILYVVSEPWYFANHRLDHARGLIDAGFEVGVATRPGERSAELLSAGIEFHEFEMTRGSSSPIGVAREAVRLRRLVKRIGPDVVHGVALKPVALVLSLMLKNRRPALILSVNGLGISAVNTSRMLSLVRRVLRFAGRRKRVELLFQTVADQMAVTGSASEGTVIPGVGVDLDEFSPSDRVPGPPFRICYLGRAVRSKGLTDLAIAATDPRIADLGIEIHAYCTIDPTSPGALTDIELAEVEAAPTITLHPPTSNPASVLAHSNAAILPSRAGEGVSKFVLEAFATGTPILLSADSGSSEVVTEGVDALTFAAANPASMADTLVAFAELTETKRGSMGAAGRSVAERRYGTNVIIPQIVALHQRMIRLERQ